MSFRLFHSKLTSLSLAITLAMTGTVSAQQESGSAEDKAKNKLETIVVTGTRNLERSLFDTLAPVDVFSEEELAQSASSELVDKLTTLAPSFNVQRLPMSDGLVFVRPATLRGLSPDHTLVLINGKRRHRSALLGSRGAQGADLAQIPAAAIKRIEVLRDGAAAQYGSDAIAGVINIILTDVEGVSGYTQAGKYFDGDGAELQTALKIGTKIGQEGFITATAEYTDADPTSRSRQRADAIAFEQQTGIKVQNPVQRWGQPELNTFRLALNSEIALNQSWLYAFATYGEGEGDSDFNWRNPLNTSAYNSSPIAYPDYDLHKIYPAGFSPVFSQEDKDLSLVTGIKGEITDDLLWDISASFGQNQINHYLSNTINASMGSESPTDFYLGRLQQTEANFNLDFVYAWENALLAYPANIAFGIESRKETYEIKTGETASYLVGPAAAEGLPSGANGFPGYGPDQAGKYDQQSYAAYIDTELALTEQFSAGMAVRYEDYSEFGNTLDGKVSLRLALAENFALRGTVSTGFRAPTPGQLESTRTSQGLDTVTLNLFTTGRLAPSSPVAQYFGAQPLTPEESVSFSVGATFRTDSGFSGSVDMYQINVDDRFGQSQSYAINDEVRQQLLAQGVPGAETLTSVNFFTNAFDTQTQGIDIAGNYALNTSVGELTFAGAVNYNKTEVTRQDGTIGDYGVVRIEKGLPNISGNLSATLDMDSWQLFARMRYFGKWTDASDQSSGTLYQEFGSEIFFDIAATYKLNEYLKIKAGIENLFNSYPDEASYQASRGLIYSRNAPYDTDGGQYYLRLDYKF